MEEGHLHWLNMSGVVYIISSDAHCSSHQEVEKGFVINVIKRDNIKENLFIGLLSK